MAVFLSDGKRLWGTKHSANRCSCFWLVDFVVYFGLQWSFINEMLAFAACMAIQHRKVEIRVVLKHPLTETIEGELYRLRQEDTDCALSDAAESQNKN